MELRNLSQHNSKTARNTPQVQTQAQSRRKRTSQLWQDLDTNKYFMIDAAQGSQRKVNEIGENVKQYYESVSGSASFMKRVEHAHL